MTRRQLMPRIAMAAAIAVGATLVAAVPAHAEVIATHRGMTWHVRVVDQLAGVVNVGADDRTDAYAGDTAPTTSLPVLCLQVDGSPPPPGITLDQYNGWARGTVGVTPAIAGRNLTSLDEANRVCVRTFGAGWRIAEHHDGWYQGSRTGWHFWAKGTIPAGTDRFWVHINDQNANCWTTTSTPAEMLVRIVVRRFADGATWVVYPTDTNPRVPELIASATGPMYRGLGPMYPPGSATTPQTVQVFVSYSDNVTQVVTVNDLSLAPPVLAYVVRTTMAIGHQSLY